jgi:molecular chaperone GrpE
VLDNLELALRHAQADPAAIVAGVQAVSEQTLAVLSSLGYQRIDEVGARFDPVSGTKRPRSSTPAPPSRAAW